MNNKHVHFIAIGGSAMHNLAIALHLKGYKVTGSDDEIFDPAYSHLAAHGILPEEQGWFAEKITSNLDAVIVGMHARSDNPELAKAKELGLKIYSFPEYVYEQSKDKTRVVIGGSHGKTTITAMILHVLKHCNIDCDYLVGAKLQGYDVMVKLSEKAKYIVIEGDEYLTSPLDLRPKFHIYKPDIALVSGIAWDHMNVFPTFENYVEQFKIFMNLVPEKGSLVYCATDKEVLKLAQSLQKNINKYPYTIPAHVIRNGQTFILYKNTELPVRVFGSHNLMNIEGAKKVCMLLGVSEKDFYEAISTFSGASNRLELIFENKTTNIYRDFAHAPSKLKATISAVKEQFPNRSLVACFELHTYSSLNKAFLNQYKNSLKDADIAAVYFSPHALELKKLPMLNADDIKREFDKADMFVFSSKEDMLTFLKSQDWETKNLLLMSSGNYDGIDIKNIATFLNLTTH